MTSSAMVIVTPLDDPDRPAWQRLAKGYNDFYETVLDDADYDRAWGRLREDREIHGLGARLDGRLVGIAHFLFHANIWRHEVCYLQDLFVDEAVRGQGAARALIEAVADAARRRGAARSTTSSRASAVSSATTTRWTRVCGMTVATRMTWRFVLN